MDIFTDASLNDRKKIAGISAVFVPQKNNAITCCHSYFSASKIETAELLAIAVALSLIDPKADKNVRIISDSKGALKKLQRIFHHPNQKQIQTIIDSIQKKIMYNISSSFSKHLDKVFSFCCIHGHQHKAQEATDAYYNAEADQQALIGRMDGEEIYRQEKEHPTGITPLSSEERMILNQPECPIVAPKQISFSYENTNLKPYARRRPKNLFIRSLYKSAKQR